MKKYMDKLSNFIVKNKFIILGVIILVFGVFLCLKYTSDKSFNINRISAKEIKDGIISNNTAFIVETKNGSLKDVEEHLYIEPAYEYEVKRLSGNKYEVDLKTDIPNDTLVNLAYVENEVPVYKWAFQTKKGLDIVSIYPSKNASYVSIDTYITITFNNPDVENLKDYFVIEPSVDGNFEQDGRVWNFIPSKPLEKDKTYRIKIMAGLKAGENELKNTYETAFDTYVDTRNNDEFSIVTPYQDNINNFLPEEQLVFKTDYYSYDGDAPSVNKAVIKKFAGYEDFLNYIKTGKGNTTNYKEYKATFNKKYNNIELNKTLPVGYYLVEFLDGDDLLTNTLVQVNNIAGYALKTEKDLLVWVSVDKELKENIKVKFNNQETKSDEHGLATLKNINDYSDKDYYLLIGDKTPLVVGLYNSEYKATPKGYLYTDRPIYKTTDTINIWGYVPLDFFYDKVNLDEFKLRLDNIYYPVKVNSDGTFITKIDLDKYSGYGSIELSYKDDYIAYRNVDIYEYTLDYYKYDIDAKTNIITAGDTYTFDVKVTHITGLPAVNKEIIATYDGKTYTGETGDSGIVTFKIPTKKVKDNKIYYSIVDDYITIEAGGIDNTENYTTVNFWKIVSNIDIKSDIDDNRIFYQIYNIDSNKTNNYKELEDVVASEYQNDINVQIIEEVSTRHIDHYETDRYTNTKEPVYTYSHSKSTIDTKTLHYENGGYTLLKNSIDYKENTDDIKYYYYAELAIKDKNSNSRFDSTYIYRESYHFNEDSGNGAYDYGYGGDYYYFYDYIISTSEDKFSIKEEIPLMLKKYYEKPVTDGTLLEVFYKENILDYSLVDLDNINSTFKDNYYPGVGFTGAYYKDGKFYRTRELYFDYDEEDSKLNIEIATDKDEYKPQGEVELTVKVTDKDGNLVNGKINISVVNEAIFNNKDDDTNILYSIYRDKDYDSYTYSSYFNKQVNGAGGGDGDDVDSPRSDFGDTIFFDMIDVVNGVAKTKFKLNDQITSFRITVHAVTKDNKAGVNTKNIKTQLPLAIATIKPLNIKTTDDVVIAAYATNSPSNKITYTFSIEGIEEKITKTGKKGEYVSGNFGKLPVGKYKAIIKAKCNKETDSIAYEFEVVETAQEIAVKKTMNLNNLTTITPSKNPIYIEIYNKEMQKYIYYLDILKSNYSDRLDTVIAYYKAWELENKYYGIDREITYPDLSKYVSYNMIDNYGNGTSSSILTALVNYYAGNYIKLVPDYYGDSLDNLLILASLKEPVLTDLNKYEVNDLDIDDQINLGLAYAFIGDYDHAKGVYKQINKELLTDTLNDLYAILATFVDKDKALDLINNRYSKNEASGYIRFAIISYLLNNNARISKKESVEITTSEGVETIELNGLQVKEMIIFDNELKDLEFKTKSKDLLIDYYYKGKITELDQYKQDIKIYIAEEITRGDTVNLIIDISKLENRNGIINAVLPSSLRLSKSIDNEQGLYVMQSEMDRFKISLSEHYKDKIIIIPLYVAQDGNYEIEPIIFNSKGNYSISNSYVFDSK